MLPHHLLSTTPTIYGVTKDEEKGKYHLEEAAIGGYPDARHNPACSEGEKGRTDRAVKHLIITANLGYDKSIQALKERYEDGEVSREDFAAALRVHQAAVDAMESPQREAAAKAETAGEVSWGSRPMQILLRVLSELKTFVYISKLRTPEDSIAS